MVDVTDRTDVDVRLGPLELRLSHCGLLLVWCVSDSCFGYWGAEGPDYSPRTFLMISSAMFEGTSAYESNSIEYDA